MKHKQANAFKDAFIREVNVSYRKTKTQGSSIKCAEDIAKFVRSVLTDNSREHLVALYLDGAHNVASYSIISIGTANFAPVCPREIFQRAVLVGAVALVIAHNHPSANLEPSREDIQITKQIVEAGKVIGIPVHDHIIIAGAKYTSFAERGLIA